MSRFHEALQKARMEQKSNDESEFPSVDSIIAAEPTLLSLNEGTLQVDSPVAPDRSLLQRCSHQKWSPDPSRLLFTSDENDVPGKERFRTLRSRLYQLREIRKLSVIAVSSAMPGEGKTFVSANLAYVFAKQHERRVLLIDADLRQSTMSGILGSPSFPGLSDYIGDGRSLEEVIHRGDQDNLFFLPSGRTDQHPGELIASQKLQQLIEKLRPLFDWIVIDTPPVIPVSDASILAGLCDGVILVVNSGSTDVGLAARAKAEFKSEDLLGVVLNRCAEGNAEYYKGHRYGYGSGTSQTVASGSQRQ
jgi:capsular exopolysaccharide synthesis family protein